MPYIVMIGVLMGVVIPIWRIVSVQIPKGQYTNEQRRLTGDRVLEGTIPIKKKALVHFVKRLMYRARVPCKTTELLS